jgi:hypothetical protein
MGLILFLYTVYQRNGLIDLELGQMFMPRALVPGLVQRGMERDVYNCD